LEQRVFPNGVFQIPGIFSARSAPKAYWGCFYKKSRKQPNEIQNNNPVVKAPLGNVVFKQNYVFKTLRFNVAFVENPVDRHPRACVKLAVGFR